MGTERFDGLAEGYDHARPHYPREIMRVLADRVGTPRRILDVGAGTGISLIALHDVFGDAPEYAAIDVSADMIAHGRRVFPRAHWAQVAAEPYLETQRDLDLVLIAQAYHWLDAPRLLAATQRALRPGGTLAVLYNNRLDTESAFLDRYESLLEGHSFDYRRDYRHGDLRPQFNAAFPPESTAQRDEVRWERAMSPTDFLEMSRSSTRTQRAIDDHGDSFLDPLRALIDAEAAANGGVIRVPYRTELTTIARPL